MRVSTRRNSWRTSRALSSLLVRSTVFSLMMRIQPSWTLNLVRMFRSRMFPLRRLISGVIDSELRNELWRHNMSYLSVKELKEQRQRVWDGMEAILAGVPEGAGLDD